MRKTKDDIIIEMMLKTLGLEQLDESKLLELSKAKYGSTFDYNGKKIFVTITVRSNAEAALNAIKRKMSSL